MSGLSVNIVSAVKEYEVAQLEFLGSSPAAIYWLLGTAPQVLPDLSTNCDQLCAKYGTSTSSSDRDKTLRFYNQQFDSSTGIWEKEVK